jgi:hypothetical protein
MRLTRHYHAEAVCYVLGDAVRRQLGYRQSERGYAVEVVGSVSPIKMLPHQVAKSRGIGSGSSIRFLLKWILVARS